MPCSCGRPGSRASICTSSALSGRPLMNAPRIFSAFNVRVSSTRLFASSTSSPVDVATAVGPARSERSPLLPDCSAARAKRLFFTT